MKDKTKYHITLFVLIGLIAIFVLGSALYKINSISNRKIYAKGTKDGAISVLNQIVQNGQTTINWQGKPILITVKYKPQSPFTDPNKVDKFLER